MVSMEIRIWLEFDAGPQLVIHRQTGIFYRNQTSGHSCMQREAEGFLIPLISIEAEEALEGFFKRYNCWPPYGEGWLEEKERLEELQVIVKRFSILLCNDNGLEIVKDQATFYFDMLDNPALLGQHQPLEIDIERLSDLEEGWIPVKTILGDGILAFENCD